MALPTQLLFSDGDGPKGPRGRRRALWRTSEAQEDRAVLLEWFSVSGDDLERRLREARQRRAPCHINLLRVLDAGVLGEGCGYVVSEAPLGMDMLSVLRAARPQGGLPTWWLVAVSEAVARGLQELHPEPHGALSPAHIFVGWHGEVQLLAFSALEEEGTGLLRVAPELRLGARFCGPPADVFALAQLLLDLLPPWRPASDAAAQGAPGEAQAEPALRALLAAATRSDPQGRPGLRALREGLRAYLQAAGPAELTEAIAAQVQERFPRESLSEISSGGLDIRSLVGEGGEALHELAARPRAPEIAAPPPALAAVPAPAAPLRSPRGIPLPYLVTAGLLLLCGILVWLLL